MSAPEGIGAGGTATGRESVARTLDVPGARLHYEVRGSGPLLLLVGSPMGARGFAAVAEVLAEDHTVVTYDPRGILGSTVDDPAEEGTPDLLADDVERIIAAVGGGPAYVFGNSGGGVTALALATRHPAQVRSVVVHEPPLVGLLPPADGVLDTIAAVCDDYVTVGRGAALRRYTALTGIEFAPPAPAGAGGGAPDTEAFTLPRDVRAILDRFFRCIVRPTVGYRPDTEALRAGSGPVVVAGGTTSRGQLYHRTAAALAERLDTPLVEFPGDHVGFQGEPEAFARRLRAVLAPL